MTTQPSASTLDAHFIAQQIDHRFNGYSSLAEAFIEVVRPYQLDDQAAQQLYWKMRKIHQKKPIRRRRPYHEPAQMRKAS